MSNSVVNILNNKYINIIFKQRICKQCYSVARDIILFCDTRIHLLYADLDNSWRLDFLPLPLFLALFVFERRRDSL